MCDSDRSRRKPEFSCYWACPEADVRPGGEPGGSSLWCQSLCSQAWLYLHVWLFEEPHSVPQWASRLQGLGAAVCFKFLYFLFLFFIRTFLPPSFWLQAFFCCCCEPVSPLSEFVAFIFHVDLVLWTSIYQQVTLILHLSVRLKTKQKSPNV